jgi:hypothetical protein
MILGKRLLHMKVCVDFLYNFVRNIPRRLSEILSKTLIGIHVKYPLFLSDCNGTWILDRFPENAAISDPMKIRPVGN